MTAIATALKDPPPPTGWAAAPAPTLLTGPSGPIRPCVAIWDVPCTRPFSPARVHSLGADIQVQVCPRYPALLLRPVSLCGVR